MKLDKSTTVAFSGHRSYKMKGSTDLFAGDRDDSPEAIAEDVRKTVGQLYDEGFRTFLCGMAEGFDILAGEVVAAMKSDHPGIRLVAVVPFVGQSAGFASELRERYDELLAGAGQVVVICPSYSHDCFHRRNDFLVRYSSALVCYFNGSKGGTQYTVRQAIKAGHRIINVY